MMNHNLRSDTKQRQPGQYGIAHNHMITTSSCTTTLCRCVYWQLHPFFCPNATPHRKKLWCEKVRRRLTTEEVLGTPEGVRIFGTCDGVVKAGWEEWSIGTTVLMNWAKMSALFGSM